MTASLDRPLLQLRSRIAEMVAAGPIRSRDAYRILRGEGWSQAQIDRARRRVVVVSGRTRGAWWTAPVLRTQRPKDVTRQRAPRQPRPRPMGPQLGGGSGEGEPRRGPLWGPNGEWLGVDVRDPKRRTA